MMIDHHRFAERPVIESPAGILNIEAGELERAKYNGFTGDQAQVEDENEHGCPET